MVNTETLNQAIEENLNTLEEISESEYASHIKKDILAWIRKLKTMHGNLEIWIDAQRYWINLDIIYNSTIFSNIFGETTKQFINTRLQFQRIMWSSYKNPKVLTGICKGQKLKKLRIIQEEESAEDETLFFQELVDLLLQYLEVDGHFFEDFDP